MNQTAQTNNRILENLNTPQLQAVCSDSRQLLVLAGAGSGKTRVLVHRIAWILDSQKLSPRAVLAVTFTNKAAAEMRHRIEDLLQYDVSGMWVGTFHGIALKMLRIHWQEAGLKQSFQIIDSDDQLRIVKRALEDLSIDAEQFPPKPIQWYINNKKDQGTRPQHIDPGSDPKEKLNQKVYEYYETLCARAGLVDFAELLLRAHELILNNPSILKRYQQRFQHILIDEFQDTNRIQYAWIRLLADSTPITIVGDDDQSIYGWRGAEVENIRIFQDHFPKTEVVRLEQNYRSTNTILTAANQVIAKNSDRMGKNLWTEDSMGDPIKLYTGFNELDEARFIADTIESLSKQYKRNEIAVLYRSNAQSRAIEEALVRVGMSYRIYGGLRFFDRAEIKDALAYLRLMASTDDDAALQRCINTPTRGIGSKTIELVRKTASAEGCSLWRASELIVERQLLTARAQNALQAFQDIINNLIASTAELSLAEQTEQMLYASELLVFYEKDKTEKGRAKIDNLKELISACKLFSDNEVESPAPANTDFDLAEDPDLEEDLEQQSDLMTFIHQVALESDFVADDGDDDGNNAIQLMTLHSAKGLEFPVVFMTGLEEGLFPHQRSIDDIDGLSEERRLCYVGITRAMQQLYLSYAESRRVFGKEKLNRPSRFLRDIPEECLDSLRVKHQVSRPVYGRKNQEFFASNRYSKTIQNQPSRKSETYPDPMFQSPEASYQLGSSVQHPKFGLGVILAVEGKGVTEKVQINFEDFGSKWLMLKHTSIELV